MVSGGVLSGGGPDDIPAPGPFPLPSSSLPPSTGMPAWPGFTVNLRPRFRAIEISNTDYSLVESVQKVHKIFMVNRSTSAVAIRIATTKVGASALEYTLLDPGDSRVIEALGNERLSMQIWSRVDTAGTATLLLEVWQATQ